MLFDMRGDAPRGVGFIWSGHNLPGKEKLHFVLSAELPEFGPNRWQLRQIWWDARTSRSLTIH